MSKDASERGFIPSNVFPVLFDLSTRYVIYSVLHDKALKSFEQANAMLDDPPTASIPIVRADIYDLIAGIRRELNDLDGVRQSLDNKLDDMMDQHLPPDMANNYRGQLAAMSNHIIKDLPLIRASDTFQVWLATRNIRAPSSTHDAPDPDQEPTEPTPTKPKSRRR